MQFERFFVHQKKAFFQETEYKKKDLHFMGWTHMGIRKTIPVTIFQTPPKIKLAVRSTWPVSESDKRMGKSVPRSPRDPDNSPKRIPDLNEVRRSLTFSLTRVLYEESCWAAGVAVAIGRTSAIF